MATPRKATKGHTQITADLLTKMDELYTLGLSSKKIAPFLNIGESTAKKYICVLNAVRNGTDFNLASDLNWKAITDFCVARKVPTPANLHGIPEPKEPEQIRIDIKEEVKKAQPTLSDMLESIAFAFSALSEYLTNLIKED